MRGGSFVDGHDTVTNGHLGGIALGLVAGRGVETPALKDKADIRMMVIEIKCGLLVMINYLLAEHCLITEARLSAISCAAA